MNALHRQAGTFLVAGALSTALHFAVLWLLAGLAGMPAVAASSLGYLAGAALNYLLNRNLTFRSRVPHRVAVLRFAVVAGTGFAANALLMHLLATNVGLHYLLAQALTTGIVLVWNFAANRLWTFEAGGRSGGRAP